MTRWGIAATVRAPAVDILNFAAHHLDLGAHRVYIYLDAPNAEAWPYLKGHPKVRVTLCDDAHWKKVKGRRPPKHQLRQTANATHAYARRAEVDWLAHVDVDEFIWPHRPLAEILSGLGPGTNCARMRPAEALSGDGTAFKAFIPAGPAREATVARLYPRFGADVKGGFLSHLAGKLFVRTGLGPLTVKIHNVFRGEEMNPGETELDEVALLHCHAKSWQDWYDSYRYRLEHGSYRAELPPTRPRREGGVSLHELFRRIETEAGEAGLRAFHEELCADTPALRARLEKEGLLRLHDLDLTRKRREQFPDF